MYIANIIRSLELLSWVWLHFYCTIVEIRFISHWFLNINPYCEPFSTLWAITNPAFKFGRGLYPRFFGMDFTPIINLQIICSIINLLESNMTGV